MDIDSILKKNKTKRNNYVNIDKNKNTNISPKIKYVKNLISRSLLTIIFVLGSVIFTNLSTNNKNLYQKYVLEDSLSFTKINNLYKKVFGKVDITNQKENDTAVFSENINYSNITKYKNSFKLEVKPEEVINVLTSGVVVFIGNKDDLGNTVIIQGNDGVDIWYSNITDSDIQVYDYVEAGTILGTCNSDYVYLTLNKDGKYLNYEEYLSAI